MGQISSWDNGFYTGGMIEGISTKFLIDTGSTASLISIQLFDTINPSSRPHLKEMKQFVNDVNGSSLKVYGHANMNIRLGETEYIHTIIVCKMKPQAIIGQDFLMQYIRKIDYEKLVLSTKQEEIQCWTGGETCDVCRIFVADTVSVPALTSTWIKVNIPNGDHMANTVHMQAAVDKPKSSTVHVTDSVFSLPGRSTEINIINSGEHDVTIYSNTNIGQCISVACQESLGARCAQVSCSTEELQEVPEFLSDLLERSSIHLNEDERKQFQQLLIKYHSAFAKSDDDLGVTNVVQHHIDTQGAAPIKQPFRRQPLGKRETERKEVEKMLSRGIIEPSISPWSSPVVLLTKKDGSTRFCVDFRAVNEVVKKDSFPLARIDECLESLAGSRYFSCMDLNQGYLQIGISTRG